MVNRRHAQESGNYARIAAGEGVAECVGFRDRAGTLVFGYLLVNPKPGVNVRPASKLIKAVCSTVNLESGQLSSWIEEVAS